MNVPPAAILPIPLLVVNHMNAPLVARHPLPDTAGAGWSFMTPLLETAAR